MNNLMLKLKIFLLDKKPFSRPWYQYFELPSGISNFRYVQERGKLRTNLMRRALDTLNYDANSVVLDVGSNAGIFGIYLSNRVKKILCVELDPKFHRQAMFLKQAYSSHYDLENVMLLNKDINNLEKSEIHSVNILILSKVIYHNNLNNQQDHLLDTLIHDNVNTLIMQGHTTQGELGGTDFMDKVVANYGFKVVNEVEHPEYPIIIAKRININ